MSDRRFMAASGVPGYVGRFAPSPSGPLHRGSMVAALASYLDARAHGGRWLVRIEDIDRVRSRDDAAQGILQDLCALGFHFDEEPWFQSRRLARYQKAFGHLLANGSLYACSCSRREIADSQVVSRQSGAAGAGLSSLPQAPVYPGTCRTHAHSAGASSDRPLRAWRFRVSEGVVQWVEGAWLQACAGPLTGQTLREDVAREVGDFVIARPAADGSLDWTYQLSVVVDDAESGITHVVRGMDLIDSTARQICLQQSLGFATPQYWHCPLVLAADGQKLSKQNGAAAIDTRQPLKVLNQALLDLHLPGMTAAGQEHMSLTEFWSQAVAQWRALRCRI